ncbi:MAG: sugar phosphate isomerase/epimerase family protein [Bacteroidia bacterium]|nr:sugar phosphate isomerase/epimerase family protein [Bacteroidia bacterium]
MPTRRRMLKTAAAGLLSLGMGSYLEPLLMGENRRFRIGACDWSIGKMADPSALEFAARLGLDGVQVSVVNNQDQVHLHDVSIGKNYRQTARKNHTAIGGLAIGRMNEVPYKSDPRTEEWVSSSIDLAQKLGVKAVLLAFFGKGDLKGDKTGTQEVIRRLKKIAPKAEKAGVILGIESWLSAKEHIEIIDAVESPNVQVYYDVANSEKMGYDIYEEILWLGKSKICEFHFKENDFLLGTGRVDFQKIRTLLDEIDYSGWVVIEGATPKGLSIEEAYLKNVAFVKELVG